MREDEYSNLIGFEHSASNTIQQLEEHFKQLCQGGGGGGAGGAAERWVGANSISGEEGGHTWALGQWVGGWGGVRDIWVAILNFRGKAIYCSSITLHAHMGTLVGLGGGRRGHTWAPGVNG